LRIAINGYFLQQPATGSGEHLYYLLEGLDSVDAENRYLVLHPRLSNSRVARVPHLGPQFDIQEITGTATRLGIRWGKLWWEQVALRGACARLGAELLHSPYFASPLNSNLPTVVTVHDVIPMILPAYGRALHVKIYNALVGAAARQARAILTVSEASKQDIVRTLGIPAERVHVTYNATDASLRPIEDEAALEDMREKYGITGDYLLYFGGFDLRKNVERIVRAFHAARDSFDRPCQLVLAGSLGLAGQHPLYPDPRPLIRELGLEQQVVVKGRVSEEEKPLLYSAALAFLFPSLYEGFGMPVLEAMACGTPVLTSNNSSLPEVAGDAALLVDPHSTEEISQGMVRLANDASLREELRARGLDRARDFSWEQSAATTLDVYRQVMA